MRPLLPVALAVALLAGACNNTSVEETVTTASTETATSAYCESLQALNNMANGDARTLKPSSTIEEAQAVADAVRSAYDNVLAVVENYSYPAVPKLNPRTRKTFNDAVAEFPDSGEMDFAFIALHSAMSTFADGAFLAHREHKCAGAT